MTKQEAIKEAALKPKIHRELWLEFNGQLPSDEKLIQTLHRRNFTDLGIKLLIWEYKNTLSFAGLI